MAQKLKLLLVEDSPEDAEQILTELRRADYALTFQRVEDLEQLNQALGQKDWDLIISDYGLPTLSGLDALRAAQREAPAIPFILVSGSVGEELAVQAMRAGVNDYLFKDRLARLPSAVRRELREAEVRRERTLAREERDRLLRELKEAVRARDEFIGIASHELKTPLTSLYLQIQKLEQLFDQRERQQRERQPVDTGACDLENLKARIQLMRRQMERLNALINDLLDVGQLTEGAVQLHRAQTSLTSLVREVCAHNQDALARAGCELSVQLQEGVDGTLDKTRIEQVLTNLLSNAAKYGSGKPIQVSLLEAKNEVQLAVRDRGIGIEVQDRERIFGRFERAVPDHHYGGLGMGLWIVRQLIQAHGGRVEVESELGVGSTFTVHLPGALPKG